MLALVPSLPPTSKPLPDDGIASQPCADRKRQKRCWCARTAVSDTQSVVSRGHGVARMRPTLGLLSCNSTTCAAPTARRALLDSSRNTHSCGLRRSTAIPTCAQLRHTRVTAAASRAGSRSKMAVNSSTGARNAAGAWVGAWAIGTESGVSASIVVTLWDGAVLDPLLPLRKITTAMCLALWHFAAA